MTTEFPEQASFANPLEELYVRNAPAALRLAYFLTGDPELSEDLVQEAFVRVAGRFQQLRVPDAFPAYLRRTIVNLYTSQLRRRRLERKWLLGQHEKVVVAPPDAGSRDELWSAMALLPERQRAAVVLRYYEDLSERDAAQTLGCSVGALNQLIVRALATLREHIRKDEA
ncbi:MAG: SigE family RNA polymerase sigma factor [Actinomycetota bacterium]|nr:SigE family RNA polymerase sigma factor [Actinomycetota bacterium]